MNLFKLVLALVPLLFIFGLVHGTHIITNGSETELINEDFIDNELPASYWTEIYPDYSDGDTLSLESYTGHLAYVLTSSKLIYNASALASSGGSVRFIAKMKFNESDLQAAQFFGFSAGASRFDLFTQADDTIDVYHDVMGFICDDVASGLTLTDYNIYETRIEGGNATLYINTVEKCTMYFNGTSGAYPQIKGDPMLDVGKVIIDYINYSVPIFTPILSLDSPTNTTYETSIVDLTYNITTSDPLASEPYNCTVTIDDDVNDTYQDNNNTERTFEMSGLIQGDHNVTVNCYDGTENVSETEWFEVDTILELSIASPSNTTYTTSDLTVTYLPNTTAPVSDLTCTVFFDGDANDTYTDSNNVQRTFDFTQLIEGAHNVTVNCYDGTENLTRTVYYTTNFVLELGITSPTNSTFMDSDLTLTYLANTSYPAVSTINCTVSFDDVVNTTYNTANNTAKSIGFRELNATFHNVAVNCGDGNENLTRTAYYTMNDVNFTLGQNATAYEGVTNFYNVTIGINPDIVSDVNASLYWNDTQIGSSFKGKRDLLTYWFNETFSLPIITTNNTSINTKWNVTKLYFNGSPFVENSSNTAQACWHAWDWDATTYSINLIERTVNDISVNVSKYGGVNTPINSTILATLVWNGSPSTMTATMNTSTKLGYSNTTRVPRIAAGYNWTFGFNVTVNYSLNHGILGYHSRIDTNTTYNYTQTVHTTWIGNCTEKGIPFVQTLNFFMYDENTEGAVTENFQAERIDIILADGTSRNYSLPEMTGQTNYSICLSPSWSNYSGVYINARYAINSSTYDDRRYYVINETLNNVTTDIGLYNFNGIPITFTVLDETASEVPNAYLDIRKFYASINNYRTIAMAKTGDSGTASTYLDVKLCTGSTETLYSIDIYDNRSILIKNLPDQSLSDTDCDGVAEETLKITLGGVIYDYWARNEGLSYSYTNTSDPNDFNVTVIVNDALGTVNTITLNCYRIRNIGNLLISTESIASSSATITCALGNITGYNHLIQTLVDYPLIGDVTFTELIESPTIGFDFGGDGLIAGFFLLVALAVGYATTPAMSLIALIIGLIIINAMGLTLFSLDAIVTLIFAIIFVIYIIGRKR